MLRFTSFCATLACTTPTGECVGDPTNRPLSSTDAQVTGERGGTLMNHPPDCRETGERVGPPTLRPPSPPDVQETGEHVGALTNRPSKHPIARQMRGLKKRRKFTRALRGQKKGSDQKLSNFDYQMKRQSATTEGEGRVCRGAREGGRQPVQEEGIK